MMPLWILNIFGWCAAHVRVVLTVAAIIVLLIVVSMIYKACNKPPHLDEKAIQKAEQAVKERNDAALKEILAESDVKEAQIDANVANASLQTVKAVDEAKKKYQEMTTDELAAEIERRK